MTQVIKTIQLSAFVSTVNSYLVTIDARSRVLIDCGMPNNRKELEQELEAAGCRTGNLNLILLTHGDIDHVGNAAYLQKKYSARIAMHALEAPVAQNGSMLESRKSRTLIAKAMFSSYKLDPANRFTPDIELNGGEDLSPYGFSAKILHIPGHSLGSIGILTGGGDLFCGDLLTNRSAPRLNSLIDDRQAAQKSLETLKSLSIRMVYPGHGEPFSMESLREI